MTYGVPDMGRRRQVQPEGGITLDFGTEAPASEAVPVSSETEAQAPVKPLTVCEQIKAAVGTDGPCTVPTLIETRENGTTVWYLVDIDGPSVEKAWSAYKALRPVPVRTEFLDILREIAGDAGAKFRTISKIAL